MEGAFCVAGNLGVNIIKSSEKKEENDPFPKIKFTPARPHAGNASR
jgi:hypothetical protein